MITPSVYTLDCWLWHTHYRLSDALDELEPMSNIKMKLTEDGSSIGAAFAVAMNYAGHPQVWPQSN